MNRKNFFKQITMGFRTMFFIPKILTSTIPKQTRTVTEKEFISLTDEFFNFLEKHQSLLKFKYIRPPVPVSEYKNIRYNVKATKFKIKYWESISCRNKVFYKTIAELNLNPNNYLLCIYEYKSQKNYYIESIIRYATIKT